MALRHPWHNGGVTVAQPSPRIVLVARRHIDLKRVCSCICLP
ncbi:Ms4527A family Cys-rich leader peptide [Mycobacterium sp. 1165178.9]